MGEQRKYHHKKKWSAEEEDILRAWTKAEHTTSGKAEICNKLGRNQGSIERKMRSLRVFLSIPDEPNEKDKKIDFLQEQIQQLTQAKKITSHIFKDGIIKIGVLGDTHIGSLYERIDVLEAAYNFFKKEGITSVYHTGDLAEGHGKMHVGNEYEIYAHGSDAQVAEVVKKYPRIEGITTYFILGSHDLSFWKQSGTDIGLQVVKQRPDMVYLGREEADVKMETNGGYAIMRLLHPRFGSAYAISYHAQKLIDSLSGGQKPHILLCGHTHKAFMMPCHRNVFSLQTGTCQSQTPFMRGKSLAAHLGYWILEFAIDQPNLVSRFRAEFIAIYEAREIALEI